MIFENKQLNRTTCFLLMGCMILLLPMQAPARELRISTGEYPPFTGEALPGHGFINHVISEAFKVEGYTVAYSYFPWKRSALMPLKGDFHGTSFWRCNKRHQLQYMCSAPIVTEEWVFFHLKEKPLTDWQTIRDLRHVNIGATRGYAYTEEFWREAKTGKLTVDVASSDELNFKKLLKGRIDAFPISITAGFATLNSIYGPETVNKFTYHPRPLLTTRGRLLFPINRKESEHLRDVFNRGLETIKANGLFNAMYQDLLDGHYVKKNGS